MYVVAALVNGSVASGFRLAGVRTIDADREDPEEALEMLASDPEVGVIILTEDVAEKVKEKVEEIQREKFSQGRATPIFVTVPGPEGPTEEFEIEEIVKKAVGVEIDLERIER
ncbi:V-type ATP synthase subunit F [Methanopyrus sp.]